MSKIKHKGMKVGTVSMWLLLLLSERPMYGYELIRELEKKFSGYWKPKTGTIYPALEKLEQVNLVTSQIEFREIGPDRKHYALTEKGQEELVQLMSYWTKMIEVVENYREEHQSIFRYKEQINIHDLSNILNGIVGSLHTSKIEIAKHISQQNNTVITITEPVTFKFLYAKEGEKLDIHIEIEWKP